jgi:hypothetical protein
VLQLNSSPGRLIIDVSWSHTNRHARAIGIVAEAATYTTYNKHKRRISILSTGFEPAIPAVKPLQPGWARKFNLLLTVIQHSGVDAFVCKLQKLNHKRDWQRVNRFHFYQVWGAKRVLLMFHVFWDVQEVLECLVHRMKAVRSSLEPLSCNLVLNSFISLWRCQMLMSEHVTNVAVIRTNFWISYFKLDWIKSEVENSAP